MYIAGDLEVHKTDGVTRSCAAAAVNPDGSLAVWDSLPDGEWKWDTVGSSSIIGIKDVDNEKFYSADLIASSDRWDRVESEGSSWMHTSASAIIERAEERDDVDEDEIDI